MKKSDVLHLSGVFQHSIYSPRGEIEGFLVDIDDQPAQVTIGHVDPQAAEIVAVLEPRCDVVFTARRAGPSEKGEALHPVYELSELVGVAGHEPKVPPRQEAPYRGRVQRFNYARHGEINGVVLDSGDFLHLKPKGYEKTPLSIGDAVRADGDAHRLADDRGWAVEVSSLNGTSLKP